MTYEADARQRYAALQLLGALPGRHVAVLGAMLELGEATDAAHRLVGACAASHAELLVAVGDGAALIADGALQAGMAPAAVVRVASREEGLQALLSSLSDGDTILVKASRGAELDLLVDALVRAGGVGANA